MVFLVVIYGCESWTIKKAERRRIDAFELWCCRRLLRVPWTAKRSNQSILKELNPDYSLEGLMLKLKLQYFGHLMWRANSLEKTRCWERLSAGHSVELISCLWVLSGSAVSSSLWLHRLHRARLPCLSPYPGACSNSCPLSDVIQPRVSSAHQVAKVMEFQLQHQSFQWIFRTDFL